MSCFAAETASGTSWSHNKFDDQPVEELSSWLQFIFPIMKTFLFPGVANLPILFDFMGGKRLRIVP